MTDLLIWLISAEIVGIAAYPLVFRAFPGLADRGFGLAIPAGLLLVSTLTWLLTMAGVIPNSQWAWWLVVALVAAGGLLAVRNRVDEITLMLRRRWRLLLAAQAAFLLFFALVAVMRANDPNIANTEKPMEILMLNAAVTTDAAPPGDPWLAGETVAYYYGGYWNLGGVVILSDTDTARGFNLSLALLAGMSASALFSLVASMVDRAGGRQTPAILSGFAASGLLLATASMAGWWELTAHLGIGSAGFYEWLSIDGLEKRSSASSWRPDQFWWWFRASRVINTFNESGTGLDFTIQEFPAFSFVLGDLHPHVISIPFVTTGIAAAYSLFVSGNRWGWSWIRRNPYSAAAIALIIGSSGFINQADILLMAALFSAVVALKAYGESSANLLVTAIRAAPPLALLAVVGVAVFSTFYFGTLGGQLQSPPIAPAEYGTRPIHFLTVWGLFLVLISPFAIAAGWPILRPYVKASWRARSHFPLAPTVVRERFADLRYAEDDQQPSSPDLSASSQSESPAIPAADASRRSSVDLQMLKSLDRWLWITPLALAIVPYLVWAVTHLAYNDVASPSDVITRLGTVLPLGLAFIALSFAVARSANSGVRSATQFALILAAVSVYMLFGAELFFVHDLFGNRMNTVFKFYFQVWIVASAIGGFGIYYWVRAHPRLSGYGLVASRTAVIALAVLLVGPLWWPLAAGVTKADEHGGPVTLDGWAYLESQSPGDAAAIDWLLSNADPDDRIVEAVGGGYSAHGRLAAATGLATVIGWEGHERQWRGTSELFEGRADDVRQLYETGNEALARRLLDRYEVKYVVIGTRERAGYTGIQTAKFDSLGTKVFESDGTTIYNVRGQAS